MNYRTIVLTLLEQQPHLYNRLCRTRSVLPVLQQLATELRTRHQLWQAPMNPGLPSATSSEPCSRAMELATREIQDEIQQLADSESRSAEYTQPE